MKSSAKVIKIVGVGAMVGVLGNAAFAANLVMNGKVASSNVRTIDGAAYGKVADVARALGMVVVKSSGGYEITQAGGARQINGLQGKTKQTRWTFPHDSNTALTDDNGDSYPPIAQD